LASHRDLPRARCPNFPRRLRIALGGSGALAGLAGCVARVLRLLPMPREITQRELRNDSGEVMRGLDKGDSFVVTRNGVPVGELIPVRRRRFVAAQAAVASCVGAPRIDPKRFRADVDGAVDQGALPRA
jgi:prevent-host-death family protein